MFALLEKLLVFILEGAKGTPPAEGEETVPQQPNRKPMMVVSITLIILFGLGYTWYENFVKSEMEVAKVKESQYKKTINELRQANLMVKEERIKTAAQNTQLTEKNTALMRDNDRLKLERDRAQEALLAEQERVRKLEAEKVKLEHDIEKLRLQIDAYVKDNRAIWDEIVTLGKEEGT